MQRKIDEKEEYARGQGDGKESGRQGMKKQSGGCAGSRGRAPTYRQPSWQFKGFPGLLRTRITKSSRLYHTL